jgi:2-polyprenyl-6-methoxyphenol hydroxylase-like FAD-dependent oxidoreductase
VDLVDTTVLIVGAGPVGLSLGVELGHRGVEAIIIEQSDRFGAQPRAKTTNIRSMMHFRRWGLAGAVRQAQPLPVDYPRDILFASRLFGKELARFPDAFFGDQHRRDSRFPEPAQWIPQYAVEAVMREALAGLSCTSVRLGHRLVGLQQDAAGVEAEIECAATSVRLRARYVVGADGGRSVVRKSIGVHMEGDHAFMQNFLAVYRAPTLSADIPLDPAISYWLVNPDAPAVTGPMDEGDRWFFSTQLKDGCPPYDLEEARRRIRLAIGADVPFEILETDTWSAHRLLAERYREGRVFLAGDACHLHPPMGGYGMNTGIGDAVDLGWKLAAVTQGWGGPNLLDTYATERRPTARRVIDEANANYGFVTHHMVRDNLERDDAHGEQARAELGREIVAGKAREFRAIGVVLGLSYSGSPIIASDGSPEPDWSPMEYRADAHPGRLAPHLWLGDGRSLYDLFGPGFTLLVTDPDSARLAQPLVDAAERRAFPLTLVVVTGEPELQDLYGAVLVLIRPDQHVAWRGDVLDWPPDELLGKVSGHATGGQTDAGL